MRNWRVAPWCVLALLFAGASSAQAADVDWKLYGTSTIKAETDICFYDSDGVTWKSDKLVRVWAKCLRQADIEKIDTNKGPGKAIIEESAQRVARHYLPPIATVEDANADQLVDFTFYEVVADLANVQPRGRIYYEINCSENMMRELSISFQTKGGISSKDEPLDWKYIAPETNASRLAKLLCR
jgi:hypothetical protein